MHKRKAHSKKGKRRNNNTKSARARLGGRVCRPVRYTRLGLSNVSANAALIERQDLPLWRSRGFVEAPAYPVFLGYEAHETLVLGIPQSVKRFGAWRLKGSRILEASDCCGSYGMGSPGFVGLRLQTLHDGVRWLTLPAYCAHWFLRLDGMFLDAPLKSRAEYPVLGFEAAQKLLQGSEIAELDIQTNTLDIVVDAADGQRHVLQAVKKCPAKTVTTLLRYAFRRGTMADAWLVTYDGTWLDT